MTVDANTEQIPHQHLIAELESQLHTRTSELALANARIRTRDDQIQRIKSDLDAANQRINELLDEKHGTAV